MTCIPSVACRPSKPKPLLRAACLGFLCLGLGVISRAAPVHKNKDLHIYFVDVEGGQATLFVTPAGQSLLIDTGWPGNEGRDSERIVAAARKAGISKIDYVLITHFHQDHVGGGFGSKFSIDSWGVVTAKLSKKAAGKPVKIMLERSSELEVAGARPSAYARVKVGAKKDGTLLAWQSSGWGTGGVGGGGAPPLPYVVNVPNQRKQHTAISNNIGSARAWRAPNHPQACLITMGMWMISSTSTVT
jgi:hypothetical protein